MFCIILHLSVSCLVRMPSLNLLQRRTYAQIHDRRTWIASPFTVFSASLAHVPCLALWHRVFYTFCSLARRWKYTHTHAFLKEGHGRFSRDLRLDGGCPTYCLLPPTVPRQDGYVACLSVLCQHLQSSLWWQSGMFIPVYSHQLPRTVKPTLLPHRNVSTSVTSIFCFELDLEGCATLTLCIKWIC